MIQECSYDSHLTVEQALEDILSQLHERLHDVERLLRLLPPDAERRQGLALLLQRWACKLETPEERISATPDSPRNSKQKAQPVEVPCANPACAHTFWTWRSADPQRFCSLACGRQGHPLNEQPSKTTNAHQGERRVNPGVAAANRRRGAQRREQRAHAYALQLLAEAGLVPANEEARGEGRA